MAIGYGEPAPKPEPRDRTKARKERAKHKHVRTIRKQVFADNDDRCVVCHWPAESMHELTPASVIGSRVLATTVDNSVPVCGSGTTGCHGLLQQRIVRPMEDKKPGMRFVIDVKNCTHPEVVEMMARHAEWQRAKWTAEGHA